jgi:hypothetical protein
MPKHLYETFEDVFEKAKSGEAAAGPSETTVSFRLLEPVPDDEVLDRSLALGYTAICISSGPSNRFVLLRESAPIKIGKLRKEGIGTLTDFDYRLTWNSDFVLYGPGLATPCLHLGKSEGPHWTLLLTVLFATQTPAKQKLDRLRQRLSGLQRSMTHEILTDQPPFHPEGLTVDYESETALIAKTSVGLPQEYLGEAADWMARQPLRRRLFVRDLAVAQDYSVGQKNGEASVALRVTKSL